MKRLGWLLLAPLFAACGKDKMPEIPDIPTLEVGGDGARFMTDARTPFDVFNAAYSDLTRQHLNIRRNNNSKGNRYAMEAAAGRIVRDLEIMKSVLVKPEPATLDPYIAFYKEVQTLCQQNRLAGAYASKIDMYEKEIKLKYPLDEVEVVEVISKDDKTAKKDVKKDETKKDDLPDPKEKKDDDLPQPKENEDPKEQPKTDPVKTDEPTKKDDLVSYRLLYKAWQRSHEDLCAAFKTRKEARERYEEVLEALRGMRRSLDAKKAERLQVYVTFYEKVAEDTQGFTAPPQGAKDEDVINDLKIVYTSITKDFDPAKSK